MPAIMVAGTSSHVGKSVITAAICRILAKRGYSVAPFKAQNMSLNSYVTEDGKEIAVAQAFQARACGIEPNEFMNPILLKPKGHGVSQLVLLGESVGDFTVREYYSTIPKLKKVVEEAYRWLEEEYDVIVIEGAGGIAEINLYDRDLANIHTARIAKPATIIVGDIDRGGVFASLYGTFSLLPDDVRSLVSGFVINKFRGDPSLLEPGLRELERLTGVEVLGVVPYVTLNFTPEDSVSLEDWKGEGRIAVVRLPRISNFTDFVPLKGFGVEFVWKKRLEEYEVVIVPGSKDTVADLKELKDSGMAEEIRRFGNPVIGICGGYQMLGRELVDEGVEHGRVRVKGLGLLDAVTVFRDYRKVTRRVRRRVNGNAVILERIRGETVEGYEIHKGRTVARNPIFEDEGCASEDGRVWGTYMHGLFENANVLRALGDFLGVKVKIERDWVEEFTRVVEERVRLDPILERILSQPARL